MELRHPRMKLWKPAQNPETPSKRTATKHNPGKHPTKAYPDSLNTFCHVKPHKDPKPHILPSLDGWVDRLHFLCQDVHGYLNFGVCGCRFADWICGFALTIQGLTLRSISSSFLGLPHKILNMNPKKELLWSLRVV